MIKKTNLHSAINHVLKLLYIHDIGLFCGLGCSKRGIWFWQVSWAVVWIHIASSHHLKQFDEMQMNKIIQQWV